MSAGSGGAAPQAGGGAGGNPGCSVDSDCDSQVPASVPLGCAVGKCDATTNTCSFSAKDKDGDHHLALNCKATDGRPIVVGDDCDDTDPAIYKGAWDGPVGDGHPDRCDGIDQDCSGSADDQKLKDGTSCTCTANDVRQCSQDSGGRPIAWPLNKPVGACKYGSQTCLTDGTWGPCTDAVGPTQETCNQLDDDCNGLKDDGPAPDHVPVDAVYFAYDGDNDQHARIPDKDYALVHACSFNAPSAAPAACLMGSLAGCALGKTVQECCPPNRWKFAASLQSDDCNDQNAQVNPTAPELCDGIDNDCNSKPDEGCICKPNEVDSQCSQTSNGAPITWPKGAPVGACKYGTRSCSSDGKSWGSCNGAISPAAVDNCAKSGSDDNCNGVANDGCGCVAPKTQSCGKNVGSCTLGTSSCQTDGTWGNCIGGITPKAQDSCDKGNDDNCDGKTANGFPGSTTVCKCLNGSQQKCGNCQGGTQVCSGGQWGPCSGDPQNVGNKCNVNNNVNGACVNGGTLTCDPLNPTVPKCVADDPGIGYTQHDQGGEPSAYTPAPNGSFDWDCDNQIETNYPADGSIATYDSCGDDGTHYCDYIPDQADCEPTNGMIMLMPTQGGCNFTSCTPQECDYGPAIVCGQAPIIIYCKWTGSDPYNGTCALKPGSKPYTIYKEGCT